MGYKRLIERFYETFYAFQRGLDSCPVAEIAGSAAPPSRCPKRGTTGSSTAPCGWPLRCIGPRASPSTRQVTQGPVGLVGLAASFIYHISGCRWLERSWPGCRLEIPLESHHPPQSVITSSTNHATVLSMFDMCLF